MDQPSEKPSLPVIPSPVLSRPPPVSAVPPGDAAPWVKLRSAEAVDGDGSSGLAPFNARATAAVIDLVVAIGLTIGLSIVLPDFAEQHAWLLGIAYLVIRDSLPFLGGQSVGKKAMKLQVVTLDGKSLVANWQAALIRNGVLAVPLFVFVELFVLLTREDKPDHGRRLGDEWAKTQVIAAEEPPAAME